MNIAIDESTMRLVGRPVAAILFLLPIVPVLAVVSVLFGTSLLRGAEPEWVLQLIELVQGWNTVPKDIVSLVVSSAPALAGTVLFHRTTSRSNERLAKWLFPILMVAVGVSLLCLMFLDPTSDLQAGAITGGADALMSLEGAAESSLRVGTTYCLLLMGAKIIVDAEEVD